METDVGHDNSSTDDDHTKQEPCRRWRQKAQSSKDNKDTVAVDPFPSDDNGGLSKSTRLPSYASGSAADDEDPELSELASSAKYLKNWVPRIKGDKMYVEGCLLDFDNANPDHFSERWKSTSVVERRRANVVMTRKTPYVLEGKLSFQHAHEGGLPTFIIMAFKDGFPENWDLYRKQWLTFIQQQASNNSNMSTVSSLGNVSHFVQKPKRTEATLSKSANSPSSSGSQITKITLPEQGGGKGTTKPYPNLKSESSFSSPTPTKRNKQEDGQLICQECGKLYKKYKPYQNHLQSKHGINLHAQSHRTDSTLQQRKKRSGRNSESKQTNAMQGESVTAPPKKRRGRPPKNRPLDMSDRPRPGDNDMEPDQCPPKKCRGRPPKSRSLQDTEPRKQHQQQQRQSKFHQKSGMVVSHESDNGASNSDDFVPGKGSGKGTKPPKNPALGGRGRPRKILMAAALPPDRAELGRRRQMEKRSEVALAKADKEAAAKRRKTASISRRGKSSSTVVHPSQLPERLVSNPRTVAERRDNSRILQGLNLGHNDDIFNKGGSRGTNRQSTSGKITKKTAGNGSNKLADGILNELFDSDSENDLSVHSSRTPIGKYFERGTKTPIPDGDEHNLDFEDREVGGEGRSGFMATAYIHRKIEEKRKTDRRRTKHKLHSLTSKGPALLEDDPGEGHSTINNTENRIIEEESRPPMKSIMKRRATEIRLEEPISKIMHQMESSQKSNDGSTSSNEKDEYFSDGKESDDYNEVRDISKKIAAGSRGATIVAKRNR